MNKLGRNAWVGLGVGATAGIGLVLFLLIYKKMQRRLCPRLSLPNTSDALAINGTDEPSTATVSHAFEMQAGPSFGTLALGLKRGLSVEQQAELKNQLDEVLLCVAHLRGEVAFLRGSLQDMAVQIVQDVKSGLEESQKTARRRRPFLPRERTDSMSSSSIYFTASAGVASQYDGESEAGYTTANAESDYNGETDRDTDRETERDEEDESRATDCTLRQGSSDAEAEEEEEEEEEFSDAESPGNAEALLLSQSDAARLAGAQDEGEGFLPRCASRGLDEDGTSLEEAQMAVKDGEEALPSEGSQQSPGPLDPQGLYSHHPATEQS